ncbi:MAG: T9SS type A sorting domain-containing protein [Bacteroidota bacterium]
MKTRLFLTTLLVNFLLGPTLVKAQIGSNDNSFNPGAGSNTSVISSIIQNDGKIVLGGSFTTFDNLTYNRIVRLNADGSIDNTFTTNGGFSTANGQVSKLLLQSDGDIMAVGKFLTYYAVSRNRIARINPDGSVDAGFVPGVGANNNVNTIVRQSDGKYIIGGEFTFYASVARNRIARVNTTGTLDNTFAPGTGANNIIHTIDLQPDGSIIAAGIFTAFNGVAKNKIVRLTSTGAIDATFTVGVGAAHTSTTAVIRDVKVLTGGKILVAGEFTSYSGGNQANIVRLNSDGSVDNTFNTSGSGANSSVTSISLQSDGKIIITGSFLTYNGVSRPRIARLNSDGTLDNTFNPGVGANGPTYCSAIQTDGNIILGGNMSTYYGVARTRVARISVCPTPTVSIASQQDVLCNGAANGTASVSVIGGTSFTYSWVPSGGTGASATGLAAGSYTCHVTNQCGNSADSPVITISQPSALTVTAGATTSDCLGSVFSLSSSASGGTAPYTYAWVPGNLAGASQNVNPSSTTIYTVTATDVNGCTHIATQTASVINCPGPVLTGTSCGAALSSIDQLLYFTSTAGATNYRLQIICAAQSFTTVNVRNNGTTNNFKMSWIPGIEYGRTYTIKVSAYIAGAWQPYGNACNVTTPAPASIPTTQFSAGSCNVTINALDQKLNFNTIAGATNYRFEIISAAQPFSTVNVRNNTISYLQLSWISGVQYGRSYDIRISAYINNAWQPYGSLCTVTTPSSGQLTQLTATVCNTSVPSRSTIFKFDPVAGASNYQLKLINSAASYTATNIRNSTSTNFALSYVASTQVGVTYDVQVSAQVGGVWGAYGPVCQVSAAAAKGDAEFTNSEYYRLNKGQTTISNEFENMYHVWPNPSSGYLKIELLNYDNSSNTSMQIFNTLGAKVFEQSNLNPDNEFDISILPNGIYFLKFEKNGKTMVSKIIKE